MVITGADKREQLQDEEAGFLAKKVSMQHAMKNKRKRPWTTSRAEVTHPLRVSQQQLDVPIRGCIARRWRAGRSSR